MKDDTTQGGWATEARARIVQAKEEVSPGEELLRLTLAVAVPLSIADLQKQGGPTDWQIEWAQALIAGQEIGEAILFRIPGETGRKVARLAEIIAIGAFQPGGIRVFGMEFNGRRPPFHAPQREDEEE